MLPSNKHLPLQAQLKEMPPSSKCCANIIIMQDEDNSEPFGDLNVDEDELESNKMVSRRY